MAAAARFPAVLVGGDADAAAAARDCDDCPFSSEGFHQRTLDGAPMESIRERSVDASNSTQ